MQIKLSKLIDHFASECADIPGVLKQAKIEPLLYDPWRGDHTYDGQTAGSAILDHIEAVAEQSQRLAVDQLQDDLRSTADRHGRGIPQEHTARLVDPRYLESMTSDDDDDA